MKAAVFAVSFASVLAFMTGRYIFYNPAPELSVMGVSHSLACPCECPMVLEDCHMSCGIAWKNIIGEKLKSGMGKDDITAYFYKRFGEEALLTPAQRVSGKWYQITRGGYPVKDMILFGMIVVVWTWLLYSVIMLAAEKFWPSMAGKR